MVAPRVDRGLALAACVAGVTLVALGGAALPHAAPADEGFVPHAVAPPKIMVRATGAGAGAAAAERVAEPAVAQRAVAHRAPRSSQQASPVRLQLPSLGVSARIVPVSVGSAGDLAVPDNPDVLGWWRSGARPGDGRGSVVIDGHIDSATQGLGVFARLQELEPGDPVLTESASGVLRRYWVTGRRQYAKASLPADEIFSQVVRERLVLISCGGRFDEDKGSYSDNVVVFAVPAAGLGNDSE